jgi:hypothetical protein
METKPGIIASDSFLTYINLVDKDDLNLALETNTRRFRKLLTKIPRKKINYSYAEGKWTLKEMLQHVIDAERVFVYRALTFARKDAAELPGFDENEWAITSKAVKRKWNDLIDEFDFLRASTEFMFSSFDEDQLANIGTANGKAINALALGFVCVGHVQHHMNIILERYLFDVELGLKKKKKKNK